MKKGGSKDMFEPGLGKGDVSKPGTSSKEGSMDTFAPISGGKRRLQKETFVEEKSVGISTESESKGGGKVGMIMEGKSPGMGKSKKDGTMKGSCDCDSVIDLHYNTVDTMIVEAEVVKAEVVEETTETETVDAVVVVNATVVATEVT